MVDSRVSYPQDAMILFAKRIHNGPEWGLGSQSQIGVWNRTMAGGFPVLNHQLKSRPSRKRVPVDESGPPYQQSVFANKSQYSRFPRTPHFHWGAYGTRSIVQSSRNFPFRMETALQKVRRPDRLTRRRQASAVPVRQRFADKLGEDETRFRSRSIKKEPAKITDMLIAKLAGA